MRIRKLKDVGGDYNLAWCLLHTLSFFPWVSVLRASVEQHAAEALPQSASWNYFFCSFLCKSLRTPCYAALCPMARSITVIWGVPEAPSTKSFYESENENKNTIKIWSYHSQKKPAAHHWSQFDEKRDKVFYWKSVFENGYFILIVLF